MTAVQPIAGAAGAGAIGVDVWASQGAGAAGVTDWGPVVNSLISGGSRLLSFGPHTFPFSTRINATGNSITGLIFEGISTPDWNLHTQPTTLLWNGAAASGVAVDVRSACGVTFRDMSIRYDNAAYDGDFISCDTTGAPIVGNSFSFERCTLGGVDAVTNKTARSVTRLASAVGVTFMDCVFTGALSLVRGYEAGNAQSNQITFDTCKFLSFTNAAVTNPGENWCFDSCCWEFPNAGANAAGVTNDVAGTSRFSIIGESSFWDPAANTQRYLKQPSNATWDVAVTDTVCHQGLSKHFDFAGPGAVDLQHVKFETGSSDYAVDLGSPSTALKDRVVIENCTWGLTVAGGPVQNVAGHNQVRINNNGGTANSSAGHQVTTLAGYERVTMDSTPTVAVHGGYSAPAGFINQVTGNDYAGLIVLDTNSGVAAAGLAIDVTFATTILPAYRTANRACLLQVELSIMTITGSATDAGALWAAQPYAQVANNTSDETTQTSTGFTIGLAASMASGKRAALVWRVIQL